MTGNPLICPEKRSAAGSFTLSVDTSFFVLFGPVSGSYGSKMGAAAARGRLSAWRFLCLPLIRPINSSRPPQVFMMQPTDAWHFDDRSMSWRLHTPRLGRVLERTRSSRSSRSSTTRLWQCKSAEPHSFQNCFASSAACFFPASIMSIARPSHVCSTVIVVILRTPIKWSQNSMYLATYSKPGGGTV
jgi:hypothetical protein